MENTPREEETPALEQTSPSSRADKPSVWQRFRGWRRARPFWGGLLAILAGVEIYASTQTSIGDIVVKVGVEGFQAYLIPLMLVLAGFLAWFTPGQRAFYGIITSFISVYALIGVNFGGWLAGTLLGVTAGALIFSWTPVDPTPVDGPDGPGEDDEPGSGQDTDDDADDDHTPRHAATPHEFGEPDLGEPDLVRGRSDGARARLLAVTMVPLLVAAIGVVAMRSTSAAYGACPTPSRSTTTKTPKPSASTSPAAPEPSSSASPSSTASPSASPSTGLLGQIVGGLIDLITPDSPSPSATSGTSSNTPGATPKVASSTATKPATTKTPATRRTVNPCPSTSASASPSAVPPVQRLQAAAAQPDVAAKPSLLTGSKVTMVNLAFQGIVDLPTADGTVSVLKFTMDSSVTDDFNLHTYARGKSPDVEFVTDQLTVRQNVVFYTSRFQAKLFGLIPVDYSPSHPPDIPIPPLIPIIFTDPQIDLVWVNSDVLTAKPSLLSKPV